MWKRFRIVIRKLIMPSNRRCLDNHESSSFLKYCIGWTEKYLPKFGGSVALDLTEAGTSLLQNVGDYQSKWRNITEDQKLKQHCRENL